MWGLDQDGGSLLQMLLPHPLGHSAGPNLPFVLHWIGAGSPASQEVGAGPGNLCLSFSQLRCANVGHPELGHTLIWGVGAERDSGPPLDALQTQDLLRVTGGLNPAP